MPTHIEDKDHLEVYHSDHEKYSGSETHTPPDEKGVAAADGKWVCPADWAERLRLEYSGNHEGETLPAGSDVDRVIEAVMTFSPEEAVQKLEQAIEIHHRDLSFMEPVMDRIKLLVQGHEAAGLDYDDWRYTVCKQAGLIFNWSPYPEVRSVTLPYDDPEESCETLRAWVLGIFWCIGCTIVDTCEFVVVLGSLAGGGRDGRGGGCTWCCFFSVIACGKVAAHCREPVSLRTREAEPRQRPVETLSDTAAQSSAPASQVSLSPRRWCSSCLCPWASSSPGCSRTGGSVSAGSGTRSTRAHGRPRSSCSPRSS